MEKKVRNSGAKAARLPVVWGDQYGFDVTVRRGEISAAHRDCYHVLRPSMPVFGTGHAPAAGRVQFDCRA